MSAPKRRPTAVATGWYDAADCSLSDFREVVEASTRLEDYPHARAVVDNVLIYGAGLAADSVEQGRRRAVQAEVAAALVEGPGIVVVEQAFDAAVVDAATVAFDRLIAEQKAAGTSIGDHFAKPGANDRVWCALDKLALVDAESFVSYYANSVLALVSEAWLGPDYQVTSQVNVVNPGGQAQVAHRDYHLGFMGRDQAVAYPAHVHALSPALTLQGAVAHVDMPVETGPTLYLPHSQKYGPGYLAYHDATFADYFEHHHTQLPLAKGDAVFFNPALFHGAGTNTTTDVRRMANLLQVSSAFGRAMESVDTTSICKAIFPTLCGRKAEGMPVEQLHNVITAAAEGYAFPTNLDLDQPVGSLAPQSQADLVRRALEEGWEPGRLSRELDAQQSRRASRVGRWSTRVEGSP